MKYVCWSEPIELYLVCWEGTIWTLYILLMELSMLKLSYWKIGWSVDCWQLTISLVEFGNRAFWMRNEELERCHPGKGHRKSNVLMVHSERSQFGGCFNVLICFLLRFQFHMKEMKTNFIYWNERKKSNQNCLVLKRIELFVAFKCIIVWNQWRVN